MGKSLTQKLNDLPEDRRNRIIEASNLLHAEYLTLQELRKAVEMTQATLAETLDVRQSTVAQMEKRSDLMISTLRNYVEAMGGKLSLKVEFPNRQPITLKGIGDIDEAPRMRKSDDLLPA